MPTQYFTTGDIARMCDVTPNGVIKWIKAGKLKAFKTPGGQRRIRKEDFKAFVEHFRYPVDPAHFKNNSKPRVLIVDDNREIVRVLRSYFSKDGHYDVVSASNGYEACIKAGSFKPDLIVLDIMMPNVDGYQVLQELQANEETKKTSVIVCTALNKDIVIPKIRRDIPVLEKPLNFQLLEATIEKISSSWA